MTKVVVQRLEQNHLKESLSIKSMMNQTIQYKRKVYRHKSQVNRFHIGSTLLFNKLT